MHKKKKKLSGIMYFLQYYISTFIYMYIYL